MFYVEQEIVFGNPRYSEGHYRVLESEENIIVLELYHVKGDYILSDPYEMKIELDQENNTARIQRALFNHIWP